MSSNGWDLPPPDGSGADLPPPVDPEDASEHRWFNQSVAGVPAWGLLGAAVLIWIVVVAIALRSSGDDGTSDLSFRVTTPTVARTAAPSEPVATAAPATEPTATTDAPPTTAEDVTATTAADTVAEATPTTEAAVDATTEAAATTEPPTTESATTTTSAPATATTAPPTTTTTAPPTTTTTTPAPAATEIAISGPVTATGPGGEQLTVTPRRGPCRYGPECFVAAFQISGFSYQPQEFVCEFSSGARYVFKFSSAGADPACSTLDVPDSIVVHVGGLSTEPVTIVERTP